MVESLQDFLSATASCQLEDGEGSGIPDEQSNSTVRSWRSNLVES